MDIQIFNNSDFGEVRVTEVNGEPMMIASDIAKILGYSNPQKAIRDHIDDEDKQTERIVLSGQNRDVIVINESGLYSLVLSSKMPQAKKFKRWVTSEVLPSIRKQGGYMVARADESPEQIMARAVLLANDTINRLNSQVKELKEEKVKQDTLIESMKDKVNYLDMILSCKDSIAITSIAKDYGMSGKAMNILLHELGVQYKQSDQWFLYSKFDTQGYTRAIDIAIPNSDGSILKYKRHTQWTQKGRLFLYNTLKEKGYLPLMEQDNGQHN